MEQQKIKQLVIGLVIVAVALLAGTALSSYLAKGRLEKMLAAPDKDSSLRITSLKHEAGFLHSTGVANVRFQHKCEPGLSFDTKVEYTLHHLPLPWAPLRADLKLLPTGEAAGLLDEVVDGEFALNGRAAMTILGGYRLDLDIPAISRRDGGESLEIPLNTWKLQYADPAMQLEWQLPHMEYRGASDALTVNAVALEMNLQDYRKGLGNLELSIEQVASKDSLVEALTLTSSLEESGGTVNYVTSAGAGKVVAAGQKLQDLAIEFKLAGLHAESYFLLSSLLQDTCMLQKTTVVESEKAKEALKTLLISGGSFSMSKLALASENGSFEANVEIALDKHAASEKSISFAKHLRANGKAALSGNLLPQQQKQWIVDSGFSVAAGDKLVSSFNFEGGKLTLNKNAPKQDIDSQVQQALTMLDSAVNELLSGKPLQMDLLGDLGTEPAPEADANVTPAEAAPEAQAAPASLPDNIANYISEKYQDPRGHLETVAYEVNQDGLEDYVVQLAGGDFCGSAGCLTLVFVSSENGFDIGFSENSYGITLDQANAEGLPVLVVSQHGAYCDKPGTESCTSRLLWNGKEFTVLSKN